MATIVSREIALERLPCMIRFGFAGGLATTFQLALLAGMVNLGLPASNAHLVALLASAQLSFVLNRQLTWADRQTSTPNLVSLLGQLVCFNGMIAVSMLVNQITFVIAAAHLYYLLAGAVGVIAAAGINFFVSDRLVFAKRR